VYASRVGMVAVIAAGLGGGVVVSGADGASPCGAHGVYASAGGSGSCTYTIVGEDTFTPPAGFTSVQVVAVGAPGGNGGLYDSSSANGAPGGFGAVVTAPSVSLAGVITLYVEVGGPGGHGVGTYPSTGLCPGGVAGANAGGVGGDGRCFGGSGGGGGGASDVRTLPASDGGLTAGAGDPRLVVAGGGGGGGGEYYTAGGAGGSSGGDATGGAGAGGNTDCNAQAPAGTPGGMGETGPDGGAGGVVPNASVFCPSDYANGLPGMPGAGGAGGDGNVANSEGPGGGGGGYFGGGGGSTGGNEDAAGGGGGSSYGPAGATFATAASTPTSVTISWFVPPPAPTITVPAAGGTYAQGQAVTTSFICADGSGAPGIATCLDGSGDPSGQPLDTSTLGSHTFTVAATSKDGQTTTASATYTVAAVLAAPANTAAPTVTGMRAAGNTLTCSPGSWSGGPTSYTYQWTRDGTPLAGATSPAYTVQTLDQGTTLACLVTASNAGGSRQATSRGVPVLVPVVPRCPAASGKLSGTTLGSVKLGMTRAQARKAYSHSSDRGKAYMDFFCLTPIGIRVGYASPKLLKTLTRSERARVTGRIVWASTSNARYGIDSVRPGATLAAARHRLHLGKAIVIGLNDWYLAPAGAATAVLKVRSGIVEEVGIAERGLTQNRHAQRILMASFE
jgi:hypothetical protein